MLYIIIQMCYCLISAVTQHPHCCCYFWAMLVFVLNPLCGWDCAGALKYSVNWFTHDDWEIHLQGVKDACKELNLHNTLIGERPIAPFFNVNAANN